MLGAVSSSRGSEGSLTGLEDNVPKLLSSNSSSGREIGPLKGKVTSISGSKMDEEGSVDMIFSVEGTLSSVVGRRDDVSEVGLFEGVVSCCVPPEALPPQAQRSRQRASIKIKIFVFIIKVLLNCLFYE